MKTIQIAVKSIILITCLSGCYNVTRQGEIKINTPNSSGIVLIDTETKRSLNVVNGSSLSLTFSKTVGSNPELTIKPLNGSGITIKMPESAILSEKAFAVRASEIGQKYDISGKEISRLVESHQAEGTAKCTGVGYCSQISVTEGIQKWGMYLNCPGVQDATYTRDTYEKAYVVKFSSPGNSTNPDAIFKTDRETYTIDKLIYVYGNCRVGISIGVGIGYRLGT